MAVAANAIVQRLMNCVTTLTFEVEVIPILRAIYAAMNAVELKFPVLWWVMLLHSWKRPTVTFRKGVTPWLLYRRF
jgi:hypothetical protein